jgi:hypothetical protein
MVENKGARSVSLHTGVGFKAYSCRGRAITAPGLANGCQSEHVCALSKAAHRRAAELRLLIEYYYWKQMNSPRSREADR